MRRRGPCSGAGRPPGGRDVARAQGGGGNRPGHRSHGNTGLSPSSASPLPPMTNLNKTEVLSMMNASLDSGLSFKAQSLDSGYVGELEAMERRVQGWTEGAHIIPNNVLAGGASAPPATLIG